MVMAHFLEMDLRFLNFCREIIIKDGEGELDGV